MITTFIVGSPRSGTTILEAILGSHPLIAEWYEPYYLWERFFSAVDSDIWEREPTGEKTRKLIKREFTFFAAKCGKPIVVDKLPTHSFNIEILCDIFPGAKWVHIIRDGRDVTLSIKKEWDKRRELVEKRDFLGVLITAFRMLKRQPFWRYRLMALAFELSSRGAANPLRYLNKARWDGNVGWGPRFAGWKGFLATHSELEFNAMQWVKCVEAVRASWPRLPETNKIEIRYEDLLTSTEETLNGILDLLGVRTSPEFWGKIPKLKKGNFNKWKKEFDEDELRSIKPILAPLLDELGYAKPDEW